MPGPGTATRPARSGSRHPPRLLGALPGAEPFFDAGLGQSGDC